MSTYHDEPLQGGHTGITKTLTKVQRHYYWKHNIHRISQSLYFSYK